MRAGITPLKVVKSHVRRIREAFTKPDAVSCVPRHGDLSGSAPARVHHESQWGTHESRAEVL